MSEEIKQYRMQQRRDSATDWEQNSTHAAGEILIVEETNNTPARIKIGTGNNKPAGDLKNITGEVYVQDVEPEEAGEGALWVTPEEGLSSSSPQVNEGKNPNWDALVGQSDYIKNRPFWQEEILIEWDGRVSESFRTATLGTDEYSFKLVQKSEWEDIIIEPAQLVGTSFIENTYGSYSILKYCQTNYELQEEKNKSSIHAIAVSGQAYGINARMQLVGLVGDGNFTPLAANFLEPFQSENLTYTGLWLFDYSEYENLENIYLTEFYGNNVKIDNRYESFFNNLRNNIHILHVGSADQTIDYGIFKPGDIIFIAVEANSTNVI